MQSQQSSTDFLRSFNCGVFLTLVSLLQLLMTSETGIQYIVISFVILVNGVVMGVVAQFQLYHLRVNRNLVKTFLRSGKKIPKKLLDMRDQDITQTLKLMEYIKVDLTKNLVVAISLMGLLLLSLMLPIMYSIKMNGQFTLFLIAWSGYVFFQGSVRFLIIYNQRQIVTNKMSYYFKHYQSQSNQFRKHRL